LLIRTVERLRTSDSEAYWIMQQLLAELKGARRLGSVIDPDAASQLFSAAKMLSGLEDNANLLMPGSAFSDSIITYGYDCAGKALRTRHRQPLTIAVGALPWHAA
jgi:hypothetical protein